MLLSCFIVVDYYLIKKLLLKLSSHPYFNLAWLLPLHSKRQCGSFFLKVEISDFLFSLREEVLGLIQLLNVSLAFEAIYEGSHVRP